MDKNIWEQISAALECREIGEPLNAIAALCTLIGFDECCGSFILLFLLSQKLPLDIWKIFIKFCSLTITFPPSTKSHQNVNFIIWGKSLLI
jgi:hypothetical protein